MKPKVTTTKAVKRTSTSKPPFTKRARLRSTRSLATTIKSINRIRNGSPIYYPSGSNPFEAGGKQEVSYKNHSMNTGLVIAVTCSSLTLIALAVVFAVLLVRKFRRTPARNRRESAGNAEEAMALQTFHRNDDEAYLRELNDAEEHLNPNDDERQAVSEIHSPVQASSETSSSSSEISFLGYVYRVYEWVSD